MPASLIIPGAGGEGKSIVWRGLGRISDNIFRRGEAIKRNGRLAVDKIADDMEVYAKANAPWQDRTGDARSGLHGWAEHDLQSDISTAYLAHGVDYGIWLELMGSGEFAIIAPTIAAFQAKFMRAVVSTDSNFTEIIGSLSTGGDGE